MRFIALIILLAGLDVAGAVALKEAQLRREPLLAIIGVALFVALALVLYMVLDTAELTIVSIGWVVAYQAAVMGVDVAWYDAQPTRLQVGAIVVALAALAVAALAPPPTPPGKHSIRIPVQRREQTLEERLHEYIATGNGMIRQGQLLQERAARAGVVPAPRRGD